MRGESAGKQEYKYGRCRGSFGHADRSSSLLARSHFSLVVYLHRRGWQESASEPGESIASSRNEAPETKLTRRGGGPTARTRVNLGLNPERGVSRAREAKRQKGVSIDRDRGIVVGRTKGPVCSNRSTGIEGVRPDTQGRIVVARDAAGHGRVMWNRAGARGPIFPPFLFSPSQPRKKAIFGKGRRSTFANGKSAAAHKRSLTVDRGYERVASRDAFYTLAFANVYLDHPSLFAAGPQWRQPTDRRARCGPRDPRPQ